MLQAFAGKRSAPRRAAEQESARAHVRRGPDEVRDALETEHGVVNEKGDRVDAVRGIRGARGNERRHRAGFGNSLFQNLPVFRFLVVEQRVHVHGLVPLAHARVDAYRAEQRFHAERACLVGNNGHDQFANFRVLKHLAEHSHKRHRRGNFSALAALEKFLK